MTEKRVPIILDTDPGIDDAVAIAAAIFHPEIDLRLITTVAGNVTLDKTTNNALKLVEFFGKDIPVAAGATHPLTRPLDVATHVHGHSGMDGYTFDEPTRKALSSHAIEAMYGVLMSSEELITLVPIGPLTNIALLLTIYPECKEKIDRIVLMGGSAGRGNHTPNAEFNMCVDPEAAEIVFASGLDIVMCGLDVTNKATLPADLLAGLPELNRTGAMLYSLFLHYRSGSVKTALKMHDLCAIAYLVKPELFTTTDTFVAVETAGKYTAGTTVVDLMNRLGKTANAKVCLDVDVDAFRSWFSQTLAQAI